MAFYDKQLFRNRIVPIAGACLLWTSISAVAASPDNEGAPADPGRHRANHRNTNGTDDSSSGPHEPRSYEAASTEHTNLDETRRLERAMRRALKSDDKERTLATCNELLSKCDEERARKRIDSADTLIHTQGMEELYRLAQTYLCRGITYGEKKSDKESMQDFDKALSINPNFSTCLTNRGILLIREGKPQEALKDLEKAIALNPLSWDAHVAKSDIHKNLGDTKAYAQDRQELAQLASKLKAKPFRNTNADYSQLALAYDTKLISVHPQEATYYGFRASAYQSLGNYKEAIKDAAKAISLKPSPSAYAIRAEANYQLRNLPQAQKDIEQAIKMTPANSRLYDTLARVDWELGNQQKAIADRTKQLQIDPSDPVAQINAGSMNYASGHYEAAIKNYTAALRLRGHYDRPTLLGYRGFSYANLKRYAEALADANEAIKLDPNCCSGYLVRGMCYNRTGKFKEAKQSLDRAAALAPNEAEGMRLEGELAAKTGDFEQATDYMQYADQLDYHLFLGAKVPEIKQAEYVQTIKEYSKLLKSDPKNKEALYNRAVLYLCVNEPLRANVDLAKFLTLADWQGTASWQAAMLMNIAFRQQGKDKNAAMVLENLKERVPEKDRTNEMKYLFGEITENDALRAATDRSSNTMIHSYAGLDLECKGQKDRALAHFAWIARRGDQTMDGFSLALSGLSRLQNGVRHVSPADLDN